MDNQRNDFWNEPVKPLAPNEYARHAIYITDYFYEYFREGDKSQRKARRSDLRQSSKSNLEIRYNLARSIYRYAEEQSSGFIKTRHLNLAARLFYATYRLPNPRWAKAGLYLGTIHSKLGRTKESTFFWTWVAQKGDPKDDATRTAMLNLGSRFRVDGQRGEAIYWLERSSKLGNETASRLLKDLLRAPRPIYGLDPRGAELLIQEWMVHWGFHDAKATPIGPDGGFDVISSNAAAQVKFRNQSSTLDQINSFHGACNSNYRHEIFVSKSGFTRPALETGTAYGMALFSLADDGTPIPLNSSAKEIFRI
jgi:hypothetical protein